MINSQLWYNHESVLHTLVCKPDKYLYNQSENNINSYKINS